MYSTVAPWKAAMCSPYQKPSATYTVLRPGHACLMRVRAVWKISSVAGSMAYRSVPIQSTVVTTCLYWSK